MTCAVVAAVRPLHRFGAGRPATIRADLNVRGQVAGAEVGTADVPGEVADRDVAENLAPGRNRSGRWRRTAHRYVTADMITRTDRAGQRTADPDVAADGLADAERTHLTYAHCT